MQPREGFVLKCNPQGRSFAVEFVLFNQSFAYMRDRKPESRAKAVSVVLLVLQVPNTGVLGVQG